jgi:hypothetical protein
MNGTAQPIREITENDLRGGITLMQVDLRIFLLIKLVT